MRFDFSCWGKLRLWAKLCLYFCWRNVFPVMEAKRSSACSLVPQSMVIDLWQGNGPRAHPRPPLEPDCICGGEHWGWVQGPCAYWACTQPLCSDPSPWNSQHAPQGILRGSNYKNNDSCPLVNLETVCLQILFQSEAESHHHFFLYSVPFSWVPAIVLPHKLWG